MFASFERNHAFIFHVTFVANQNNLCIVPRICFDLCTPVMEKYIKSKIDKVRTVPKYFGMFNAKITCALSLEKYTYIFVVYEHKKAFQMCQFYQIIKEILYNFLVRTLQYFKKNLIFFLPMKS